MKRKIGIFSDLHMEFNVRGGVDWDFTPESDVFYICAGDIDSNQFRRDTFIDRHQEHMFWVLGNHDYYGSKFPDGYSGCMVYESNGVEMIGATLWTNLDSESNWELYVKGLVDKRFIDNMTKTAYNYTHKRHVEYLFDESVTGYDIIVSHHCPSYKSVHPKYANSLFNAAFATELEDRILAMKNPPKLWVHGHTHEEFDYMIGSTRVICHPRGYPKEQPWYYDYQPKIVEIEIDDVE